MSSDSNIKLYTTQVSTHECVKETDRQNITNLSTFSFLQTPNGIKISITLEELGYAFSDHPSISNRIADCV